MTTPITQLEFWQIIAIVIIIGSFWSFGGCKCECNCAKEND